MKKNAFLLVVLLGILLALTFCMLALLSYPYTTFQGLATQGSATLAVTIAAKEANSIVPPSGNFLPSTDGVKEEITQITGLTQGWAINITTYGEGFPGTWSNSQPNSSQVGNNTIEYFEVDINTSTAGGSYNIYFNITQADLAGVNPSNISLFVFNNTWQNLSTVVVNANTDPRQFYGITSHFSKFLIAQRPTPAAESGGSESGSGTGAGSGSGGGGGGSSSGSKKSIEEKPSEEVPEEIKKPKPILKPVHKPGILFDVSLTIPENYRKMFPGETLIGEIYLLNIKKIGLVPVQIEYSLQDVEGNTFLHIYETKTIENELTYIKKLALPVDLQPGEYLFYIKVDYGEDTALAGYPFEVIKKTSALAGLATFLTNPKTIVVAIPMMVILIVVIIMILYFMHRKNKKARTKIKPNNQPMQKLKSLYRR